MLRRSVVSLFLVIPNPFPVRSRAKYEYGEMLINSYNCYIIHNVNFSNIYGV